MKTRSKLNNQYDAETKLHYIDIMNVLHNTFKIADHEHVHFWEGHQYECFLLVINHYRC